MIAAKPVDLRAKLKEYLDNAFNGEPVIVSRKNNRNVVIVSEHEYNELVKAKKNAEYLAKIDESIENHKRGDTISFTMEELREMEAEDWTPTEKVLEFERKYGIRRNEDTTR
ncbi:MAG TPA: antitoxin PHD [Lachnospiraceae bacterium]|nr:antitoxin PHD [Lachnospiraceae bacterium]